jgi:hypothetical protein
MRIMVVQIITIFHNRWIYYYYLVGKIDIYNTDAKSRKTKWISLKFEAPLFKSYWKQDMKEILYWWIFKSFDFELIGACETFSKDD